MDKWIKFSERYPKAHVPVLAFGRIKVDGMSENIMQVIVFWHDYEPDDHDDKVNDCYTHWMPLPDPPKEVSDG